MFKKYKSEIKKNQTPYGMEIVNESSFVEKYKIVDLVCEASDLLIVDFKVIHRSGINISNRPRWTMQMRYFNFNDPLGISKGWPGGFYTGKDLATLHPELLFNN